MNNNLPIRALILISLLLISCTSGQPSRITSIAILDNDFKIIRQFTSDGEIAQFNALWMKRISSDFEIQPRMWTHKIDITYADRSGQRWLYDSKGHSVLLDYTLKRRYELESPQEFNLLISAVPAKAKRQGPKEVDPVVHNGVKYIAPHFKTIDNQLQHGYIEAWDITSQKKLWELQVYKIQHDSRLERDVTECAHCKTPMELTIDSDLNYTIKEKGCEPMVFMPDVDLLSLKEESIITAF